MKLLSTLEPKKTCSKCGVRKPESAFPLKYDWRRPPGARKSVCKQCCNRATKERKRERLKADPEAKRRENRKKHEQHKRRHQQRGW